MIWALLFLAALTPVVILAAFGPEKISRVWPAGLLGVFLVYIIDSMAVKANLYRFEAANLSISGIPLFYMLTAFPVAVLVYRFLPRERNRQFVYLGLVAGIYLLPEMLFARAGYFHYINWSLLNSFFLNLGALIALVYLGQLIGLTNKPEHPPVP